MKGTDMSSESNLAIHKARWVVPVSSPPILNGAVAVFGENVVAVGKASEIQLQFHGAIEIEDHGDAILCPALINAHSHLELSPLKHRLSPAGSFTEWVKSLIKARDKIDFDEWLPSIEMAVDEMIGNGVIAVGDVANNGIIPLLTRENGVFWPLRGVIFKEIINPGARDVDLTDDVYLEKDIDFEFSYSAHSLFSVNPETVRQIKALDTKRGVPFSIHVAESPEEIQYLKEGTGPIKDLLEEKGHSSADIKIPHISPVKYLHRLGVLDEDTICVHGVHLNREDMEILSKSQATVCLCPRSNIFLGVGISPSYELHSMGINLALGTDSLASNDMLSIFAEMSSLSKCTPSLSPEAIFKAATLGGANALGLSREKASFKRKNGFLGSLEPGSTATFISVRADNLANDNEIFEYLVNASSSSDFESYWIVPSI